MRLSNLDEYVKNKIITNEISAGHGRAMLSLPADKQIALTDIIIKENLSVREVEKLVRDTKKPRRRVAPEKDKYIAHVEEMLSERFSSRVNIKKNKNKGKIEIEYINNEDLNRILDLLNLEE